MGGAHLGKSEGRYMGQGDGVSCCVSDMGNSRCRGKIGR